VRNPETHQYHEGEKNYQRIDTKDRNKQQFDEDGEVIDSSDEDFEQPSDEDAQGNALSMRIMDIDREDDTTHIPNKGDAKPSAEEEEQTRPSPERQDRRLRKCDDGI
jgi:hypothetical protein